MSRRAQPASSGADAKPSLDRVFYDGHCGLCHCSVRFLLDRDRDGSRFRFAPLDSDAFRLRVGEDRRAALPDSLVVLTADGRLLTRSAAALHALRRLGGFWGGLGGVAAMVPRPLRDLVYDLIAKARRHLFRAPDEACPYMPPELRRRFEL